MLEAMLAAKVDAPTDVAAASAASCAAGLTVAQLMKTFPAAPVSSDSP
jgi:hypothetical protein